MQTIELDLAMRRIVPLLHAKQNDVGKKVAVVLTDNGAAYSIPVDAVFSVWYSGASGEGNYTTIDGRSAFSVSGNTVTVELILQMLQNKGPGQLCLVMNKADGTQLGLWNIPYFVEEIPGAGSQEATAYYTAFTKAIEDLPYPDTSLTVPNKAADSKTVGDYLRGLTNQVAVERARIDQFTSLQEGSTTGDAELADLRVDAYGKTHDTAGNAVRGQVAALNERTDTIAKAAPFWADYQRGAGWLNKEHGSVTYSEGTIALITPFIPCESGDVFEYLGPPTSSYVASVVYYDSSKVFINSEQLASSTEYYVETTAPEKASYVRFCSFKYVGSAVELKLSVRRKTQNDLITRLDMINSNIESNNEKVRALEVSQNNAVKVNLGDAVDIATVDDLLDGFVDVKGNIAEGAGLHSDYIDLAEHPTFYVTTSSQYATYLGGIYDENKDFLATIEDFLGVVHQNSGLKITDERITQASVVERYPTAQYVRFSLYPTSSNFKLYYRSPVALDIYLDDEAKQTTKKIQTSVETAYEMGNPLYGKKYVACGDSFTEGDFSYFVDDNGLSGKDSPVAYDSELKMYKTYPWWIAKRNGMTLVNEAKCGSDFTNVEGASNPFSVERYLAVPTDADYITLMFGLNEIGIGADNTLIGTESDTTNATLWGAYNIVFEHFLTNMPYAKIGVIIPDAWCPQNYADAVIAICRYWGISYLNLKGDDRVPMGIGGRFNDTSAKAKALRNAAFQVSAADGHPNVKAHEYRSTIIEHFLRSL